MVAVAVDECVGNGEAGGIEVRKMVGEAGLGSVAVTWVIKVGVGMDSKGVGVGCPALHAAIIIARIAR